MCITNASIGKIRMDKSIQTIHLFTQCGHFMPSQKLTSRVCKARECTLKMSTTDVFKVCSEVKAKCGHRHKLKQSVQSVVTGRSTSVVTSDSSHNDEPHPPHIGVSALFLLISSIFSIHSPALLITRIDHQCRTVLLSIISYQDCTRVVPGLYQDYTRIVPGSTAMQCCTVLLSIILYRSTVWFNSTRLCQNTNNSSATHIHCQALPSTAVPREAIH